jgi:hypothetical protein
MCYYTPITYPCGHRPDPDERTYCDFMDRQAIALAHGETETAWKCYTTTPRAPKAHNRRCKACHAAWLAAHDAYWEKWWARIRDILCADGRFDPRAVARAMASVRRGYQSMYDNVLRVQVGMTRLGYSDVYQVFPGWIEEHAKRAYQAVDEELTRKK